MPTVTNASTAPSLAVAASLTLANVGAGTAPAGTFVFPGTITAGTTNSVLNAAEFPGSDCGAKINAADTALGSTGGEIDVNLACGTTWTTPVVLSANHNLFFVQAGTYIVPSISALGFNIIDLRGSELQIPAYSTVTTTAGMIGFYNGSSVGSNVTIQNGILDGNWANTPTANTCAPTACRPAIRITNGGNAAAVHDISMDNLVFQNWNNPPFVMAGHDPTAYVPDFPLPYNISIHGDGESCKFQNLGGNGINIYSFDHNVSIRGCHFTNWGDGLTVEHADAIATNPIFYSDAADSYPGTTDFTLDVSGNIFDNTQLPADGGWGYVGEFPAGGTQWVTDFKFNDNQVNDGGTGKGACLSGVYKGAVIEGNYWSAEGVCEGTGTNLTIDGNTISGTIVDYASWLLPSTASEVSGNTLTVENSGLFAGTGAQVIQVSGFATQSIPVSQVIHQTAQNFNIASGTVVFTPQTVAGTPPSVCITSSAITGGTGNAYLNWAFTVFGAANTGNNGTFILTSSTANSVCFVDPRGVSETLPSGATLTSSATTADYIGTLGDDGSFNGLAGQDHIGVTGFTNATNNTGTTTAAATAYSWSGGSMTITGSNAWAVGQIVTINSTYPDPLSQLNGLQFAITSASSSQYSFSEGSVSGAGATSATSTSSTLIAIANSMTVIATTNPSAVNETHAGTLAFAPGMYDANIGSNTINMAAANSNVNTCAGIVVGDGTDGEGPVYNSKIHDNTIFAPGGFAGGCPGIFIPTAYTVTGMEFTNNDVKNLPVGYWFNSSPGVVSDITINGGKFTNVAAPVSNANNVPIRFYNYVNSHRRPSRPCRAGRRWTHAAILSFRAGLRHGVFVPGQSGAVTWN